MHAQLKTQTPQVFRRRRSSYLDPYGTELLDFKWLNSFEAGGRFHLRLARSKILCSSCKMTQGKFSSDISSLKEQREKIIIILFCHRFKTQDTKE